MLDDISKLTRKSSWIRHETLSSMKISVFINVTVEKIGWRRIDHFFILFFSTRNVIIDGKEMIEMKKIYAIDASIYVRKSNLIDVPFALTISNVTAQFFICRLFLIDSLLCFFFCPFWNSPPHILLPDRTLPPPLPAWSISHYLLFRAKNCEKKKKSFTVISGRLLNILNISASFDFFFCFYLKNFINPTENDTAQFRK